MPRGDGGTCNAVFAAASTGMSLGVTGTSTDQKNVKMDEAWIL